MPSLTDIANQVNNTLTQINTNTQNTADTSGLIKGDTADIKIKLDTLNTNLLSGFSNISTGIAVLINEQKNTNNLLDHQRKQNDTVICWLKNIADVLCRQLHRLNTQIKIQSEINGSLKQTTSILELVHGTETVLTNRHKQIIDRMDKCCPMEEEEPEHCYEDCRLDEYHPHKAEDIPWQPLKATTDKAKNDK